MKHRALRLFKEVRKELRPWQMQMVACLSALFQVSPATNSPYGSGSHAVRFAKPLNCDPWQIVHITHNRRSGGLAVPRYYEIAYGFLRLSALAFWGSTSWHSLSRLRTRCPRATDLQADIAHRVSNAGRRG